ncbi:IS200/IS605 family element transposase accessory protein TnpB [Candidatus Poribacteria bacterium]|nr:IS200/IS605 family element transposase accessory protein TnpB [Candidatus Poribacteria bacterium]
MQLVEQHLILKTDNRFQVIDNAAFASKNLYNFANYVIRQEFIHTGRYITYPEVARLIKDSDAFRALPAKVAQQVLINLDKNWQSFFASREEWKEEFQGRPRLPKYKEKLSGRHLLVYTTQAISKRKLRQWIIKPSQLDIEVRTKQKNIKQVRIVPRKTHYVLEVVYEKDISPAPFNPDYIAGVDIGLNNLAAVASNKPGFVPVVVNGRPLKSINQYFNKKRANLQSQLSVVMVGDKPASKEFAPPKKISQLTDKRNRKVKHELHVASRRIVDHLVAEEIGNLVIGKNPQWKHKIHIGRRNNQNFVSIPHAQFVSMLTYKARLVGIKVIETEESYTSKCSFLDLEPIQKQEVYLGKRIQRGLFQSHKGRKINADVNGAYNILRKVAPNAFSNGVEGVVVHPLRVSLKNEPVE